MSESDTAALNKRESETEAEADPLPDEAELEESIKWKIGTLKTGAKASSKEKNRAAMVKRLIVGFFVMAVYINCYLFSTLTMAILPYYLLITIQSELLALGRNSAKDKFSGCYKREWGMIIAGHLSLLPSSLFDRSVL